MHCIVLQLIQLYLTSQHVGFLYSVISWHYNDVIMGEMASQVSSLTIVYSTVYSRRRTTKTSKPRVTGLCEGNWPVAGEFPAQRASNAENVSIWWRHHDNNRCDINWLGTGIAKQFQEQLMHLHCEFTFHIFVQYINDKSALIARMPSNRPHGDPCMMYEWFIWVSFHAITFCIPYRFISVRQKLIFKI